MSSKNSPVPNIQLRCVLRSSRQHGWWCVMCIHSIRLECGVSIGKALMLGYHAAQVTLPKTPQNHDVWFWISSYCCAFRNLLDSCFTTPCGVRTYSLRGCAYLTYTNPVFVFSVSFQKVSYVWISQNVSRGKIFYRRKKGMFYFGNRTLLCHLA